MLCVMDGIDLESLDRSRQHFCGELICFVARLAQNKTGRALKAIDQLYLVAGAGFEPTTFGL
jgi:hypothetical protein